MPRYESGTKNAKRFWEIELDGTVVTTRYGQVGSDGRTSAPKTHASREKAEKDVAKKIADKLKKGFVAVDDEVEEVVNPALVDAILKSPDDEATYLVYADWLQSQGDPRGEFIMVQHQRAAGKGKLDDKSAKKLEKSEAALLKKLAPSRLEKLRKKKRTSGKAASGYCNYQWRWGFIHSARIGRNSPRPPHTVRELVVALLAHPSARVLQSLTIGALGPDSDYDYSLVVEAICRAAPAGLRELFIADFTAEHSELSMSSLGDVSGLYAALPRLERLHLRGGSMALGTPTMPGLRELELSTVEFSPDMLQAVAYASWPKLEKLVLQAGGTTLPESAVAALVSTHGARELGALRHLALAGTDATGDLWRAALRDSPLLRRLEFLDLSAGSLTDQDAESLLSQRRALEHLAVLDLRGNFLTDAAAASLVDICADVRVSDQRPPTSGRVVVSDQAIGDFAPDGKSMTAARKLTKLGKWPSLGSDGSILWGRCQGSTLYDVYVDTDSMDSGCTCPSMKYPCKHSIALLMLTQNHVIPAEPPPPGFVENCQYARYDSPWE